MTDIVLHRDVRGTLVAAQEFSHPVVRVYVMTASDPDTVRANHAHRETTQTLVCVEGQVTVTEETSTGGSVFSLRPGESFLQPPMVWMQLSAFAPGTILLVAADTLHDEQESDYIRDHDEFLELVGRPC